LRAETEGIAKIAAADISATATAPRMILGKRFSGLIIASY
jgi:hypothetical protein